MKRRRQLKRWSALGGCALLSLSAFAAALAGWTDGALAGLALIVGAAAILVVDIRLKAGDVVSMLARGERRHGETMEQLHEGLKRHRAAATTLRQITRSLELAARTGASRETVETVERRVLATLEAERLLAADRHHDLVERAIAQRQQAREAQAVMVSAVQDSGSEVVSKVGRHVRGATRELTRKLPSDMEGLLYLQGRVRSSAMLPGTGGFALDARSLAHLVTLVESEQPATVVELGSGTSTVWMALLLAERSGARLVTIEHDAHYAELTREQLRRHGVEDVVDLRLAPLRPSPLPCPGDDPKEDRVWYDTAAFADLTAIDLLFVDGPPAATGRLARWPALPVLKERLAPGALVIMDDAPRDDETEVLSLWAKELPEAVKQDEGLSRLAVLRLPGTEARPGAAR